MKLIKAFQHTLFVLLKITFIIALFLIFFYIYRSESPELQRGFNRVSAIISSTFIIVNYMVLRAYGGLSFGHASTKELALSTFIATGITDVITYAQFCIMEKNIMSLWRLAVIFLCQCIAVTILVKLGNDMYSGINPPKKLLIIHNDEEKCRAVIKKLESYRHRFEIYKVMRSDEEELHRSIRASGAVMLIEVSAEDKNYICEYCYKRGKDVCLVPTISDILVNSAGSETFDDVMMLRYKSKGLSDEQRFYKRLCDLVICIPAVIILTPLMILEAVAIKLEDGGSVFYSQERTTIDGKLFKVLKFRTMIEDAEKDGAVLASQNDGRITKVGGFLRKTRLDEIPQLLNIIKGDMSIVGPRPERQELNEEYEKGLPEFSYRLRVKAGLTGLAQIEGNYNTSPKDKLNLDLMYIENYSLGLDFKIMLRTLVVVFLPHKSDGV